MKTFLITGSTRGLGLEIVRQLSTNKDHHIIMAIRDESKGSELARQIGNNVSIHKLDLSRLSNITDFLRDWKTPLDGLINNAGVQIVEKTRFTHDGFEETIAVNHLAAFALTMGFLPFLKNGRVLFIGSGTHNPSHPQAKLFGFRGSRFTSMENCIQGIGDATSEGQLGLDRYATSKFLNTISTCEFARRYKQTSFFALDPGLMPGTGLARNHNWIERMAWSSVMRLAGLVLPDVSSPKRSAKAANWMLTSKDLDNQSGAIYSYNRRPNKYIWKDQIENTILAKQIFDDTNKIVKRTYSDIL